MSVLYLIRHGQASFGADNYDKLSPMGIRQARILGSHLTSIGIAPDAVYSGAMSRQTHTAEEVRLCYRERGKNIPELLLKNGLNEFDSSAIIISQLPDMQKKDPLLAEHLPRMYESRESFKRIFEGAMLRWVSGGFDRPGVESWKDFLARVSLAITQIMEEQGKGRNIFVFTSGGPIAAALQFVLGVSPEAAIRLNWQIVNTSYTKVMYNAGRITMACFNCTAHLELEQERSALVSYR